jgi:2-polyprenyl-3-methyl-5-hydroxy-6-metoxy-1,4-benzoquinol methylase
MTRLIFEDIPDNKLQARITELYRTPNKFYVSLVRKGPEAVFDESYRKSTDPDGVKRDLTSEEEMQRAVSENSHIFDTIKTHCGNSKGINVLDFGCGCGPFLPELQRLGFNVYGAEIDEYSCREAAKRCPGAKIICTDIVQTPIQTTKFEAVIVFNVLEHIERPELYVQELHALMSHGGIIAVTVPNFDSPCARRYGKKYRMYHDETHITLFSEYSLINFMKAMGFEIIDVHHPYFESERFFNTQEFERLKDTEGVSPPFIGNMVTVYARKPWLPS